MDTLTPECLPNPFTRVRGDWGWNSSLQPGYLQGSPSSEVFPVAGLKTVFLRSHLLEVLLGRGFTHFLDVAASFHGCKGSQSDRLGCDICIARVHT